MISHELRAPLTSIVGALGLLNTKVDVSTEAKELLHLASRNADRLQKIISDILDIERIQLSKLEMRIKPMFLFEVVQVAIQDSMQFAIENKITLVEGEMLPSAQIQGDPERLEQVLLNLLSNAIKFSFPGGKVIVKMEQRGPNVRVSVIDQGKGVPVEQQELLFEKFVHIEGRDTRIKGTGLGLYITKSFLEKMGGSIGFVSELNIGSTFYFEFPIFNDK
jgi:signal transduction histidine kinase